MNAKETKLLLLQLAKGETIANPEQARQIHEKLEQDASLQQLLESYKVMYQNNELHLLEGNASLKRIHNQALIEQLKEESTPKEIKDKATIKLLTDSDFRAKYEQAFPINTAEQTRIIPLKRILKYSIRIAATLTLLIVAWWFTGQALVYKQTLEAYQKFEQEQLNNGAATLGGDNQLSGSICNILDRFDYAVENKAFVYIPDGGVRVKETGNRFGVKYYVVQEEDCEVTVLVQTNNPLPKVGERVSFDARAFEITALGQSLRALVEEQRHIVY